MNVFEYDDFPRDGERLLSVIDGLKRKYPKFLANVFAIPSEMDRHWHAEIEKRRRWVRLYPHGFRHKRGECRKRRPTAWNHRVLSRLRRDGRWGPVFKAPHHGYSLEWMELLQSYGFSLVVSNTNNCPYPMPADWRWWNHKDALYRDLSAHRFRFIEAHPVYDWKAAGAVRSQISKANVHRWRQQWGRDDDWGFVEYLLQPALKKIHLGCGPHVFPGWMNLDPRTGLDPRIIKWTWDECIPVSENKADLVFSSHTLNYLEEDRYEEAFLDIWRVLRPGGIYRLSEDDADSGYVWRKPGQGSRGTGEIKSAPRKARIMEALRKVGFTVQMAEPGATGSPHKDVLNGDSRARHHRRGHKFYAEATKDPSLSVIRVRRTDPRATKLGRFKMPPEE